jgi:hydroxyacylglutathione hydrolase
MGTAQAEGIAYIRPAEAKQRLERTPGIVVLDVRTPEEYATGHLANSVLLPVNQVEAQAATVLKDRNAPVLIYCHSGSRSDRAAKVLKSQGYTNVMSVVGGIVAWSAAGYPVVK